MRKNLRAYQTMASIVGVLLIVLILIGVPLANFDGTGMWGMFDTTPVLVSPGSEIQGVGEAITAYLGTAHGWLYMIFLFCAFLMARRAEWPMGYTLVILACGTVPILSFWAERKATNRLKAEHPELRKGAAQPAVA